LLDNSRKSAVRFIVFLGAVSLFADIAYEGARSILGPFFLSLGASAAVVGAVAGAGELAGYALRLFSGYLADRTKGYWSLTILGYAVNLISVPLLALAGRWETAAALVVAERTGKSIRNPARDVMLSQAAAEVGRGWGFGLHTAMDQIGAVLGPLLVAAVFARTAHYRLTFGILAIPALLAIAALLSARAAYPHPHIFETPHTGSSRKFPRQFWLYIAAAGMLAAGYVDFPLVAYHLEKHGIAPAVWSPLLYAIAMAANGLAAPVFGKLFDRSGIAVLSAGIPISLASLPLSFLGGFNMAVAGMICWGVGIGAQDACLRAGIANLIPSERRGTAYGIYNTVYGAMWFLGSAAMGKLYESSVAALVIFGTAAQAVSIALFAAVRLRASE
jgi:MFS family permease